MNEFIAIALWAIFLAVVIGIWGSILRRIGYSWWYALLLVVPIVFISIIVIAAKVWPIERELARLRLMSGESADIDTDVESVLSYAITYEQKGQWDRAASLYHLAEDKSLSPQTKQYVRECLERLAGKPQ